MTLNVSELKEWTDIGNMILTVGLAFLVWLKSFDKSTNIRIDELSKRTHTRFEALHQQTNEKLDSHSVVIGELKIELANSPTHADLQRQYELTARQNEKLDHLLGAMAERDKVLQLIHQYLLEKR